MPKIRPQADTDELRHTQVDREGWAGTGGHRRTSRCWTGMVVRLLPY
jgi:hypothetical protein